MSNTFENKGALAATIVVAASNSLNKGQANYVCDGANDHVEIQAALDALPATGGEVLLLDGTFNIEVSLVLDSYQTLRGCGRNTILTTTTADTDIITATGGSGTEKVGIVIADLYIYGNSHLNNNGILFTYVDYSQINHVYCYDYDDQGISLITSDHNIINDNICMGGSSAKNGIKLVGSTYNVIANNQCNNNDTQNGIYLYNGSSYNVISENVCCNNSIAGIEIDGSGAADCCYNMITGNVCCYNLWDAGVYITDASHNIISNNIIIGTLHEYGIELGGDYNVLANNFIMNCAYHGIDVEGSDHNEIIGNICIGNGQDTTNTYADIFLDSSNYNNIQGNTCRAGALVKKPKYGIDIYNAACNKNVVANNDLYDDGFGTGAFNDAGTLTQVEDNNRGIKINQIKMFRYMKNTSGAQRVAGDVVSLKAVAAGNEVTAPAAIGERQVYGMVAETINDAAWGLVQVKGKTTALKGTNAGGGDIAIGDNLITENGVRARKAAAATDPIFARALEALAAADGVIDAYILSPWD